MGDQTNMKTETQTRCKCKGALFSVPVSRMEEAFDHRKYECDRCHEAWKFIPDAELREVPK